MNNKLSEITEFILSRDNFLILTHERPDGDAVASVSALQLALMNCGKNSEIYFGDKLQDKLVKYLDSNIYFSKPEEAKLKYSCIICLDSGNSERLSVFDENLLKSLPVVNMDHHPDNTFFGIVNYINPQACATAEIIFDMLRQSPEKWTITGITANSILMGILMDTGGLRFDNTSVSALHKTGELITMGADYIKLIKDLFQSKPLKLTLFESDIMLNHLKINHSGRMAHCCIIEELLDKYCIDVKDTDGLIDALRSIKGVIIAAVISKNKVKYKASLRSNSPDFPVNEIAHKYNGGGHLLAAGLHIDTDNIEEVEKILIKEAGILFDGK